MIENGHRDGAGSADRIRSSGTCRPTAICNLMSASKALRMRSGGRHPVCANCGHGEPRLMLYSTHD